MTGLMGAWGRGRRIALELCASAAHISSAAPLQRHSLCAGCDGGAKRTRALMRDTVTYSSSDSSSPDGRLTSSSSSPAFLLRDDIV